MKTTAKLGRPPQPRTTQHDAVFIYALVDHHNQARYVGKANDPDKRLKTHQRDMRSRRTPLYDWLRTCGYVPEMRILERCCRLTWPAREIFWISEFRGNGKLLNLADGGNEPACPRETRAANGRKVAIIRDSTPLRKRICFLKRTMAQNLRSGIVSAESRAKVLRAATSAPEIFGSLLRWVSIQ